VSKLAISDNTTSTLTEIILAEICGICVGGLKGTAL
jgi:hypothetical protein